MNDFWLQQLKKGFELALKNELNLKEKNNMENKIEIMSNELAEINNIIAIAKADDDVRRIFLSEVVREFDDLQDVSKSVFFQDTVFEILELAKHDDRKKQMFFKTLLESELGQDIQEHFYEYFASNGQIKG